MNNILKMISLGIHLFISDRKAGVIPNIWQHKNRQFDVVSDILLRCLSIASLLTALGAKLLSPHVHLQVGNLANELYP